MIRNLFRPGPGPFFGFDSACVFFLAYDIVCDCTGAYAYLLIPIRSASAAVVCYAYDQDYVRLEAAPAALRVAGFVFDDAQVAPLAAITRHARVREGVRETRNKGQNERRNRRNPTQRLHLPVRLLRQHAHQPIHF